MESAQDADSQSAHGDGYQEAAVLLGVGEQVGVGQASPDEHRRNHH